MTTFHQEKLYVGAPKTETPLENAVSECTVNTQSNSKTCKGIRTRETNNKNPKKGEWMGGSMAADKTNLYACAFLQSRMLYKLGKNNSLSGRGITGACYKKESNEMTLLMDFTRVSSSLAVNADQDLFGNKIWRQEGGLYGFSVTVSPKSKHLVASNPIQVSRTCGNQAEKWARPTGSSKTSFGCHNDNITATAMTGVVGEVITNTKVIRINDRDCKSIGKTMRIGTMQGNNKHKKCKRNRRTNRLTCEPCNKDDLSSVFRTPGPYIPSRHKAKKTNFFLIDRTYAEEYSVTNKVGLENSVIGKQVGYSVAKGHILGPSGPLSYVMGAPSTHFYKGAVYLCTDCFGTDDDVTANMKTDFKSFKNWETRPHLKMGEGFGMAVTTCDINGDGLDDLIVGSPLFAADSTSYNTGRVHAILSEGEEKNSKQWTNLAPEETVVRPKTLVNGAMFGAAVSCLGDTDSDGMEEVVVGVPGENAVYVYRFNRDNNQLEQSQKLTQASKRFGQRLTPDKIFKKKVPNQLMTGSGSSEMKLPGFGVGAPEEGEAFYLKIRPVARFQLRQELNNTVSVPRIVRETTEIKVTVDLGLVWISEELDLAVTITLEPDSTLLMGNKQNRTVRTKSTSILTFTFFPDVLRLTTTDVKELRLTLQMTFSPPQTCSLTYQENCPMFDPISAKKSDKWLEGDTQTLRTGKITKTLTIKDCEQEVCKCSIVKEKHVPNKIWPGFGPHSGEVKLATIELKNNGQEPSFHTLLSLGDFNTTLFELNLINRDVKCDKKTGNCKVNYFKKDEIKSIELTIRAKEALDPNQKNISATLTVSSLCSLGQTDLSVLVNSPVEHVWALQAKAIRPNDVTWNHKQTQDLAPNLLNFDLTNKGPSVAKKPTVYALLPGEGEWLRNVTVTFQGEQCITLSKASDKLKSAVVTIVNQSEDRDTKLISCSSRGLCQYYRCQTTNMDKDDQSKLEVGFVFKRERGRREAEALEQKNVFLVVVNICTQDSEGRISCEGEGMEVGLIKVLKYVYPQCIFSSEPDQVCLLCQKNCGCDH